MTRDLRAFGAHALLFQACTLVGALLAFIAFLVPQGPEETLCMWAAVFLCAEGALRLVGRIERKWPRDRNGSAA